MTIPSTRFYGSKYKLVKQIHAEVTKTLPSCHFILDLFGGSASVSLYFQQKGKRVHYNDVMRCNAIMAKGLLCMKPEDVPSEGSIKMLFERKENTNYPTFVSDTYMDIFFTDSENKEIDVVVHNLSLLPDDTHTSLLWYLFIQACLIKRPYNLFHRNNLQMRLKEVARSFGNKKTWDTPFIEHMLKFRQSLMKCVATPRSADQVVVTQSTYEAVEDTGYDTVYMDPPYSRRMSEIRTT